MPLMLVLWSVMRASKNIDYGCGLASNHKRHYDVNNMSKSGRSKRLASALVIMLCITNISSM